MPDSRPLPVVFALALLTACPNPPGSVVHDAAPPDLTTPDAAPDSGQPDARADMGPDAHVPFSLLLTVNEIPAAMNGSAPYTPNAGGSVGFKVTVPTHGFTVDVTWRGSDAAPSTLAITCDRDLGGIKAGQDISGRFTKTPGKATLLLPATLAAPAGAATFTAVLKDKSTPRTSKLTVVVRKRTYKEDPFRLRDTWVLVFGGDQFAVASGKDAAGWWQVTSTKGKNGVADFEEDLRAAGLSTAAMLPAAAALKKGSATGTNAIMHAWMENEVLTSARKAFGLTASGATAPGAVNIRLLPDSDATAPDYKTFAEQVLKGGETSRAFSCISIGGGDLTRPYLGLARGGDVGNLRNEANISPQRGVFTTAALAFLAKTAAKDSTLKMLLRQLLGDFVPELGEGGLRVGEHSLDATILAPGFDPKTATPAASSRYNKLAFIVQTIGRLAGALTAHEMGHSLGLVPDGAPPYGLFGGETKASFTNGARTTSHHIDTPGFNLMEAGPGSAAGAKLDIMSYLSEPRFNALNLAYLRGRLLVLK